MIFNLALKNLKVKPWRTVATIAVIALAVAMFFCMFSFGDAVYEYIYAVETSAAGSSHLLIKGRSNEDKLAFVDPLYSLEDVEYVCPSLSLYALAKRADGESEYVQMRGFDRDKLQLLQTIEAADGNLDDLVANEDNVAVSEAMAERFGLKVGSRFEVSSLAGGGKSVGFIVAVIAESDGYFLSDAPYCVIGTVDGGVDRLVGGLPVYNEIYIRAADGKSTDELAVEIAAMPEYANLTVDVSADTGYVKTRADGISAPVTVSGVAVAVLCVAGIVLIFALGIADKRAYASKLTVAGATKAQLLGIFLTESAIIAFIGAAVGALLAGGVFVLLLKAVLSSTLTFSVNGLLLFGASVAGFAVALAASLYPLLKVFGSSVRENLDSVQKPAKSGVVFAVALAAVMLVLLLVENLVPGAMGVLSVVNMILLLALGGAVVPFAVRGAAKVAGGSSSPALKVASYSVVRERRASRTSQTLVVGLMVVMLLFVSWSLTTSIFGDYTKEFENMILVTNVSSDVNLDEFEATQGVNSAYFTVWQQADISFAGGKQSTTNIIGSDGAQALGLMAFEYVTPEADVRNILESAEGDSIVLDYSVHELNGVSVGDGVVLKVGGDEREFTVGGFVRHNFFNGNYVLVSQRLLAEKFALSPDTVILVADSDAESVAEAVRSAFSDRNYYAVPAIEAYKWDVQSIDSVFNLVGTLAFVLTALVFVTALAGVTVGRSLSERTRGTLLCAGLSKSALLASETAEHAVSVLTAFVLAFLLSLPAALCLVNALRLFGLYFGFMYNFWVAVTAGLSVSALYVAVPYVFGFRKRYGMMRR